KEKINLQEFDENENLVKEIRYQDDEPVYEIINTYEGNKLVAGTETDHLHGFSTRKEYSYEGDKLSRIREFYEEGGHIDTLHIYSESGDILKEEITDDEGDSQGYTTYQYDDSGKTIVETRYNEYDEADRILTTVKDEKGRNTEVMLEEIG